MQNIGHATEHKSSSKYNAAAIEYLETLTTEWSHANLCYIARCSHV